MKIKYFLRGLGVGILVTTLVLCISYRKQDSDQSVVERAKRLGMEFPKETPDSLLNPSASPDTAASGSAVRKEDKEPAATAEVTAEATVSPTPIPTEKPTSEPTVKPTKKPKTTKVEKGRTFTVRGGLLSSSVSREMRQAGIIKDSDAFDEYLEKNGLARKVRAGTYKIPTGASYEQIARIITRQD